MVSPQTTVWLDRLNDSLPQYMQTLAVPEQRGRFLPCHQGITPLGQKVSLGFSCFALKIYYTLGLWQKLEKYEQETWLAFIQSFQVQPGVQEQYGVIGQGAFIDSYMVSGAYHYRRYPLQFLYHAYPYIRQPGLVWHRLRHTAPITCQQQTIIAETKQAIATLAEAEQNAPYPYQGFPTAPNDLQTHLSSLDWVRPWEAGGQASALVVFVVNEAPKILLPPETKTLLETCEQFFEHLADAQTGAYFRGAQPEAGQLINGAMKVLTALAWLETPIHYPEKLIDTCLGQIPRSDGCHLVDMVYVLYRCLQQTEHRKAEIQTYCLDILAMIQQHYNNDGGLSYNIGRSQTGYYGAFIARGLPESDIHGTCLLTWALAMLFEILDLKQYAWHVIKP